MVRDKYGRKMSKSLGNVIDPLEVIHGCQLADLLAKIEMGNLPAKEVRESVSQCHSLSMSLDTVYQCVFLEYSSLTTVFYAKMCLFTCV